MDYHLSTMLFGVDGLATFLSVKSWTLDKLQGDECSSGEFWGILHIIGARISRKKITPSMPILSTTASFLDNFSLCRAAF